MGGEWVLIVPITHLGVTVALTHLGVTVALTGPSRKKKKKLGFAYELLGYYPTTHPT